MSMHFKKVRGAKASSNRRTGYRVLVNFEEIKFKQEYNVEHITCINKINKNTPCYMHNIKLQITYTKFKYTKQKIS